MRLFTHSFPAVAPLGAAVILTLGLAFSTDSLASDVKDDASG